MIIMKFQIKQDKNKIAKSTLAIVLAGSFAFSPALTFAAQETTNEENIEKIDLQTLSSTEEKSTEESDIKTEETPATIVEDEENQLEDIQEDVPSLVPGDFFYFTKIALEKIKLALTFNDVKEAELLATYANERLAEAEVLLSEGKENEALETIEKALDHFESTEAIIEDEKESDKTSTDEEIENNTSTNDRAPVEDENNTEDESLVEVEKMVSQNILSLQAAMEKVKNPVAKAALEKNIKKSYAKLAKKLAKLEEKALKSTLKEEKLEDEEVVDGQEVVEVEQEAPTTKIEVETETADLATPNEENIIAPVQEKAPSSIQAEKKETHAVVKQQQTQIKEEAKEAKQEIKAIKQEVKENRVEQKKKQNNRKRLINQTSYNRNQMEKDKIKLTKEMKNNMISVIKDKGLTKSPYPLSSIHSQPIKSILLL